MTKHWQPILPFLPLRSIIWDVLLPVEILLAIWTSRFASRTERNERGIAAKPSEETKLDALISMEVACQLALESLPQLPPETGEKLREPIAALCKVSREELTRLDPSFPDRSAGP